MTEEWLSVLPGNVSRPELTPPEVLALTTAPGVVQAGASIEAQAGQDATGRLRIRLRVSHAEAQRVALTRDALLRQGRTLGLRVFLV